MIDLKGRTALVTGAGRNLGASIALALAGAGAAVACNARSRKDEVDAVVQTIEQRGGRAIAVLGDVADALAVNALVDEVHTRLGPVTILINNAAPRGERPIAEMSIEQWQAVVRPILDGAYHCIHACVGDMMAARWGRIIQILGVIAHQGQTKRAHLAAAKAGLVGLTRALAVELGPSGITVNAVSPGVLDTPPPPGLDPAVRLQRVQRNPIPRLGEPAEVAGLCAYLAGPAGAFITGQSIGINGGEYMA